MYMEREYGWIDMKNDKSTSTALLGKVLHECRYSPPLTPFPEIFPKNSKIQKKSPKTPKICEQRWMRGPASPDRVGIFKETHRFQGFRESHDSFWPIILSGVKG